MSLQIKSKLALLEKQLCTSLEPTSDDYIEAMEHAYPGTLPSNPEVHEYYHFCRQSLIELSIQSCEFVDLKNKRIKNPFPPNHIEEGHIEYIENLTDDEIKAIQSFKQKLGMENK